MNGTIAASQTNARRSWWRRISLTQWMLIAVVFGIWFGWQFPQQAQGLQVLSNVFLRLIKCIIVPLLFSTLIVGIAGHGDDLKRVGRLALKSLIYFEIVTTLALFIGLAAVNLTRPGDGVNLKVDPKEGEQYAETAKKQTFGEVLVHIVPASV